MFLNASFTSCLLESSVEPKSQFTKFNWPKSLSPLTRALLLSPFMVSQQRLTRSSVFSCCSCGLAGSGVAGVCSVAGCGSLTARLALVWEAALTCSLAGATAVCPAAVSDVASDTAACFGTVGVLDAEADVSFGAAGIAACFAACFADDVPNVPATDGALGVTFTPGCTAVFSTLGVASPAHAT